MKITKEIVLEAKRIAQDDYIRECVKNKTHNPDYKRAWRKVPTKIKGDYCLALSGTPDKAFVFVCPSIPEVTAVNRSGKILKRFR